MSEHVEPHDSLHLTVVRESSKNYQSYLRKKKDLTEPNSLITKIRKILVEKNQAKRTQLRDTAGFN